MADTNFASLVRLYHATFNRASDKEGISFWASNLARGLMTFSEIADQFLKSSEFEIQHGSNISNESFVVILYKNISKRDPNETENKTWLNLLTKSSSKEKVLLQLSNSTELLTGL